jgi:hypothetical protein
MLTNPERAFLAHLRLDATSLDVCCQPGRASFSVVEETREGFRWATFDTEGACHDDGCEDSRERARAAALEAQQLWRHRCPSARTHACPGFCHKSLAPVKSPVPGESLNGSHVHRASPPSH